MKTTFKSFGIEWYLASSRWEIYSCKTGKFLKWTPRKEWYLRVCLRVNWKNETHNVHRLVAQAFLEPVEWKDIVNHLDWDKTNNSRFNLKWSTQKENVQHWWERWRVAYNKWVYWEKWKKVKQLDLAWKLIKIWSSAMVIMRETWLDSSSITKACRGKLKTCWGYTWQYNIA